MNTLHTTYKENLPLQKISYYMQMGWVIPGVGLYIIAKSFRVLRAELFLIWDHSLDVMV